MDCVLDGLCFGVEVGYVERDLFLAFYHEFVEGDGDFGLSGLVFVEDVLPFNGFEGFFGLQL